MLFVGDAAAATDVMTGEGIGQALLTGRLAAEAIAVEHGRPTDVADRLRAARAHITCSPTIACRSGSVACSPTHAVPEARSAIVAGSGSWGRRNFARWMFEDEPRAIVTTPRRWHRRFLKQPGAYVVTRWRQRRGLRFGDRSSRSSGGASTSTPSTVRAEPVLLEIVRVARRLDRDRRVVLLGGPR